MKANTSESIDSFHLELHDSLKSSYVTVNPLFNKSERVNDPLRDEAWRKHSIPSVRDSKLARLQHFLGELAPIGLPE